MWNLLTKALFVSLLLSAVIPSGIQANSLVEKLRTATALEAIRGVLIGEVVAIVVSILEGKEMNDIDVETMTRGATVGALTVAGIRAGIGVVAGSVGGRLAGIAVEQLAGAVPAGETGEVAKLAAGVGILMGAVTGAVEKKKITGEVIFALT